ncbi:hypothetical protein Tco_0226978 [Tanacetum coccineum]
MSTSAMHNAIIEAGGKDHAQMLVPATKTTPLQQEESRMEIYSSVSDEIKKRINAEAEAVHIIMTGIDNDIYSTIDACPNAKEIWKSIERLMQEHKLVNDEEETQRDKDIQKAMAVISKTFKNIYKPTNNNLRSSSNTKNKNVDNSPRIKRRTGNDRQTVQYDNRNQREVAVTRNKETIDLSMGQRALEKVHNNDEYSVFAKKKQHPEQLESSNDTYVVEKGDSTTTHDSSNMSNNKGDDDQDEAKFYEEHDLFASLIENMKLEIDESKKINKSLKKATTSLATELERYKDIKCVKYVEFKYAKGYGIIKDIKVKSQESLSESTCQIHVIKQKLSELEK